MDKYEVLVSSDKLKYLEACEAALYYYHRNVRLCPVCEKGILCDGNICTYCDYDSSYSVEEWKQMQENESISFED